MKMQRHTQQTHCAHSLPGEWPLWPVNAIRRPSGQSLPTNLVCKIKMQARKKTEELTIARGGEGLMGWNVG